MRDRAGERAPRFAPAASRGRQAHILWLGLVAGCVAIAAPPPATGEEEPLAVASDLLLKGRYAEAAERLTPLAEKDPSAAIKLARYRVAVGQRDEAEGVLK